jgi:hypothetical protein
LNTCSLFDFFCTEVIEIVVVVVVVGNILRVVVRLSRICGLDFGLAFLALHILQGALAFSDFLGVLFCRRV